MISFWKKTRFWALLLSVVMAFSAFAACDSDSDNNRDNDNDGHKHSWVEATCENAKTCSECGKAQGEALGHTWAAATCATPKTCTVCSATEGTALEHTYRNNKCTNCGIEDPAYTEYKLGENIYYSLIDIAVSVEKIGNCVKKAWYFSIWMASEIESKDNIVDEFAAYINAESEFADEVVTKYLLAIGYTQNQIDINAKFDALSDINGSVQIAIWICEDAGLTYGIDEDLDKIKSDFKNMSSSNEEMTGLSTLKEMYITVKNYYELVTTAECSYNDFNSKIDTYTDDILKNIDNLDLIY